MSIFNLLFSKKKEFKDHLHDSRQMIRDWIQGGSVKSVKLYTANDEHVCEHCRQYNGKVFSLTDTKQANFVMDNAQLKGCKNPNCRCYWRPEDISL